MGSLAARATWVALWLALSAASACGARRGAPGDRGDPGGGDAASGADAGDRPDAGRGDPDPDPGRDAATDAPADPSGRPVGAACTDAAECAGGLCLLDLPGGYCSQGACDARDCPAGSTCTYRVRDDGSGDYACLADCASPRDCRTEDGYTCDGYGTCSPGRETEDPDGGVPEGCTDPWSTDCPLHQACDLDTHECVTACSQDQPCHGGCCLRGQCVGGTDLDACGAEGWRCYDCGADCDQGAGCDAAAGICACDTCTPSGAPCSVDFNDCCSGFCAGLGGDTHCG